MILTDELITTLKKVCKADQFAQVLIRDHWRDDTELRAVSMLLSWNERDATGERDSRSKEIDAQELASDLYLNDYRTNREYKARHFYGRIDYEYLPTLVRTMKAGDDLAAAITLNDHYGHCEIELYRRNARSGRRVTVYRAITSVGGAYNYCGD